MRHRPLLFKSGIYQIRNVHNGALYVGSSYDLNKRRWTHANDLKLGRHHSQALQRAHDKYTVEGLEFEVLAYCDKKDTLFLEQRFLDALKPRYNVCPTAGSCAGTKLSEAQKAAISAREKGRVTPPEVRAKMSAAAKGRKKSPEHLAALRKYWSENPSPLKGRKLGEETKAKLSAAHSGKTLDAAHRAKIGAASRARAKIPHDTVRSIREGARKGIKKSVLSRTFGVGIGAVNGIVAGRSYTHVPD